MHIDYLKSSLGTLATQIPGATGVFHQHNLNFCCGGHHSLAEAADLSPDAGTLRRGRGDGV